MREMEREERRTEQKMGRKGEEDDWEEDGKGEYSIRYNIII